jgi:hypothetical protein
MKRIQVLLSVVALLVMMAVTVVSAFAAGFGKEDNRELMVRMTMSGMVRVTGA